MGIDSRFFKPNWESYPFFLFFSFLLNHAQNSRRASSSSVPVALLIFIPASQKKGKWKYSQKKKKKKRWWLLDDIYRVACGHRGGWLVETKERRDIYVISTGGSDQVYCRTWDGIERRRRCASAHIFLKNVHSPPPPAAATGTHHTYLPGTCT